MLFTQEYLSENAEILVQGIQNFKFTWGTTPAMDILQLCTNLVTC
jgi:hypothetical protein